MTPALRVPGPGRPGFPIRSLPVLLLLLLVSAVPLTAQRADFLFGRPNMTVTAMGGWDFPGEGSDLFADARRFLTVSRGDFSSPLFMVEAGIRATERIDVTLGLEFASSTVRSEDADYVYQDDRPILQTTEFRRRRLSGGVKAYLFPRGRSISEFVWVPGTWSPYVGGGVGVTWYEFAQRGDFVDYITLDIFESRLRSRGSGFSPHVMAGLDVTLSRYFFLRAEYRYLWGSAEVDQSVYQGYGDIDLSGSRATLGLGFRI